MTLGRFEIDFQGGQMRVWATFTLKGSLTYVTARRADRTAMVFFDSRVEAATRLWSRRSRAKSFGADLERQLRVITRSSQQRSRLQTKSSLRLDSRYNTAFIQVQTVLRKRYISRYVSQAEYYRVNTITSRRSARRGYQSAHESSIRIAIRTGFRVESHESVLYHNRPMCCGQQVRK